MSLVETLPQSSKTALVASTKIPLEKPVEFPAEPQWILLFSEDRVSGRAGWYRILYVAKDDDLEVLIILPLLSKYWDSRKGDDPGQLLSETRKHASYTSNSSSWYLPEWCLCSWPGDIGAGSQTSHQYRKHPSGLYYSCHSLSILSSRAPVKTNDWETRRPSLVALVATVCNQWGTGSILRLL